MSNQPTSKRSRSETVDYPPGGSDQSAGASNADRNRGDTQTEGGQGIPRWKSNGSFFCPVALCPRADTKGRGWKSFQSLKNHLKEHQGRAAGAIPTDFLEFHKLVSCSVCGKFISERYNNQCCPSCAPLLRAATNNIPSEGPAADTLPSLDEICKTRVRLLKYIPKKVRALWGEILAKAIAKAVHYNTIQAWIELLMLAKCVLLTPPRQGRSNKHSTAASIKLRCERWLAGERMELWVDGPAARQRRRNSQRSDPGSQDDTE